MYKLVVAMNAAEREQMAPCISAQSDRENSDADRQQSIQWNCSLPTSGHRGREKHRGGTHGHRPSTIRESSNLETDIGCDSLDLMEIMMEVEEHFDIDVPDAIGDEVDTVGDGVDGALGLLGGSATDQYFGSYAVSPPGGSGTAFAGHSLL